MSPASESRDSENRASESPGPPIAADAIKSFNDFLEAHSDHEWREVPPCVYCVPCDVRLYQGSLPESKMPPGLAEQRATCEHLNHEMYDDGEGNLCEMGEGFYYVCVDCGYKGWYE